MDGQRKLVSRYDTMRLPTTFVSPEAVAMIEINLCDGDWARALQAAAFRSKIEKRESDRLFWARVTAALSTSRDKDAS